MDNSLGYTVGILSLLLLWGAISSARKDIIPERKSGVFVGPPKAILKLMLL